ncbi:hypothetical protein ACLOJK_022516, partial [Asimina triloba]
QAVATVDMAAPSMSTTSVVAMAVLLSCHADIADVAVDVKGMVRCRWTTAAVQAKAFAASEVVDTGDSVERRHHRGQIRRWCWARVGWRRGSDRRHGRWTAWIDRFRPCRRRQ